MDLIFILFIIILVGISRMFAITLKTTLVLLGEFESEFECGGCIFSHSKPYSIGAQAPTLYLIRRSRIGKVQVKS